VSAAPVTHRAAAPAPSSRERRSPARYAPVAVVAAVMLVSGLWGLARDSSMGNDEVATHFAGLLRISQLFHLLSHVDAVHGLYYLFMHGWMKLGTSPAAIRVPSVIAMTGAAVLVAMLARRLTGSAWTGLFAGLIMTLTPSVVFYAQTARSYAMVFACVTGSTLALVRAVGAELAAGDGTAGGDGAPAGTAWRWWVAYAALLTLGGYLNELSLAVLSAHAVTLLLSRCFRQVARRWITAAVVSVVLVAPLLVLSQHESGVVDWITRPGLAALQLLGEDYFGVTAAGAALVALCVLAALLPARGRMPASAWQADGASVSLAVVALPLLIVPAGLLMLESLVAAQPLYVDRYVLYGEAGAALLAGAGLVRTGRWLAAVRPGGTARRRMLLWQPGVVISAAVLLVQLTPQQQIRTPESRMYDFGGPSRYIGVTARLGDGVLFFSGFYRKAKLGYRADFRDTSDFALALPPVQVGNFQGLNRRVPVTVGLMSQYRRIWVVGRTPASILAPDAVRLAAGEIPESQVLESQFTMTAEQEYRGITVTLWVRR
jgi:mannosyltransferase